MACAAGPRSATRAEVHGGFVWHSIPPTSLNREVRQRHPRPPAPRMDADVLNRDLLLAFAPMAVQGLDQTGGRPGQLIGLRTAGIHGRSSGALATPQASGFRVRSPPLMNNGFFPNWTQWGLNGVNRLGGISQPGASLLRPVLFDDQRAVRSLDPFGHLLDGRAFARARTAAHTGRSLLSTAHPHPRRYRCPNPGHPSGRAVARNTAPCGNGPRGRRRASCGRPWRLDLPDRRWQRQRAKRQVTSTTWPLRNRLCTNFQGRARQQLPAQTAFYPCYLLPETCWEQCPALLEGSLPTRQAIGQARQHRITQGGLFFDDLHGKPGELCSVPDVPALLGTAIPDGGARGSAYL
jgi:hypothetical protein